MEAIYRVEGANVDTSAFAGGPWNPRLQHGAAPSSLICWAVERLPSATPMRVARLTVDLMRPVPVAPLTLAIEVLREGKKIQLVSVRLLANGTEVVRATVSLPPHLSQPLELALDDVREAGRVAGDIDVEPGDDLRVDVELAEPDPKPDPA